MTQLAKTKRVKVSVHMEPEMKAFYEDIAKLEKRSLSNVLEMTLLGVMFNKQVNKRK